MELLNQCTAYCLINVKKLELKTTFDITDMSTIQF